MVSLHRETMDMKYLKLAKKFASKIKSWALDGVIQIVLFWLYFWKNAVFNVLRFRLVVQNPNVAHYDALLDAEMASLRGDTFSAARYFEAAVLYSGRRGLTQDRALAHERYGEHFLRLGPNHIQDAEFQIGEAIKIN